MIFFLKKTSILVTLFVLLVLSWGNILLYANCKFCKELEDHFKNKSQISINDLHSLIDKQALESNPIERFQMAQVDKNVADTGYQDIKGSDCFFQCTSYQDWTYFCHQDQTCFEVYQAAHKMNCYEVMRFCCFEEDARALVESFKQNLDQIEQVRYAYNEDLNTLIPDKWESPTKKNLAIQEETLNLFQIKKDIDAVLCDSKADLRQIKADLLIQKFKPDQIKTLRKKIDRIQEQQLDLKKKILEFKSNAFSAMDEALARYLNEQHLDEPYLDERALSERTLSERTLPELVDFDLLASDDKEYVKRCIVGFYRIADSFQ